MTDKSKSNSSLETGFLSAERSPDHVLERQSRLVSQLPGEIIAASTPVGMVVLNSDRQIVMANQIVLDLAKTNYLENIIGQRPGEAFGCVHAFGSEHGCGTTEFCRYCGAAKALSSALAGQEGFEECRIQRWDGSKEEALDLLCWSRPYEIKGEYFVIVSFMDIAHQKRRRNLERIFFHDILNTAGALNGYLDLIKDEVPGELQESLQLLCKQSNNLIEEIKEQKLLLAAEDSEITVKQEKMTSKDILEWTRQKIKYHEQAKNKKITMAEDIDNVVFETDATLLTRVLNNMCKNALEASEEGQEIRIGCFIKSDQICFWVHNWGYMPEDVRMQVFKRSFSTKGPDRGLGTYSMKLLSERYLKGQLSFESSQDEGTTFWACYPYNY